VDGDRHPGSQQRQSGRCPLWIQVAAPQRRPPSADGQDRQVEVVGKLRHRREEVRVTGEIDGVLPLDDVAEGRCRRSERLAPPVMRRRDRADEDVAEHRGSADSKLGHVDESLRPDEPPCPGRNDQSDVAAELPEARQVEMVVVRVRDQDGIDRARVDGHCRPAPPHRPDPAHQEGIEQQPEP
jgi:hypothetical protein